MKYLVSIILFISAAVLQAQDVRVSVDCPRVVRVGESFQMAVQVNADAGNIKLPEMSAFKIVRNYGRSESSSVSIINGNVSRSTEVTFNYIVQASAEGTQEIPPIAVTAGGKTYRSAPVNVQVVAGDPQAQGSGAEPQPDQSQVKTDSRDVFLEVLTDRKQIYQGEYITATLKLFSKLQIASYDNVTLPSFDGFFKQEVSSPPLQRLNQENIGNETFLTGVIWTSMLFPQKSGALTISPAGTQVVALEQVKVRSMFGGYTNSFQRVPRELKSRPVNITVMPLPDGKPASFTGGVGQMKFESTVDKTELKANDPVTLKVTVSGSGNLKFIDAPRINFPPDFEVYDPKVSTSLNASATAGSKTFEYLIIPRHGGTYKIPAVEFSYFDPQARQYKTLHSGEYTLAVERGEEQPGTTVISGVTREDVKYIGEDIRYLKTGKARLRRAGENFFGTLPFWLWYIIPLAVFIAVIILRRKYIRKYADVALVKNRKASRYAAKRLKQARAFMDRNRSEQFYEELSRALWGYLSDKLNIPVAELSKDNARTAMEQRNADAALTDEFTGVIDDCEFARYAPSTAGSDMNGLYTRAVDVINKMQKAI